MPDPELTITTETPGRLLAVAGQLSAATVADLRSVLVAAIAAGEGDLIVDVERAELADASGLGVLVSVHRLARQAQRRLVLRNVPARLERLFAITHLNRVLTVERVVRVDDEPVSA